MIKFKYIIYIISIIILFSFFAWAFLLYNISKDNYSQKMNYFLTKNSLIVVLTGGKGRIEKGIELLKEGNGKFLLISGVFQKEKSKE